MGLGGCLCERTVGRVVARAAKIGVKNKSKIQIGDLPFVGSRATER